MTDRSDEESVSSPVVVLHHFAAEGYTASFTPGPSPGTIVCPSCGMASRADELAIGDERRLEGASDPDDMVLVVAAACPVCAARGVIVLGYGPHASGVDADLVLGFARPTGDPSLRARPPAG